MIHFHLCIVVSTFVLKEIKHKMKLFVIEGVDGAGKSTQIKLLGKIFYQRQGYSCEYHALSKN